MLILVELLNIEPAWSNQQRYVSYSIGGLEEVPPLILSSGQWSLTESKKACDTHAVSLANT